ncbi:MAG: DNA mismatch repair endonuclease MutH [Gammaproteobacteria bacterium]|nr:DNA mismatch repair endonuclease MutH [Gammaproteobacteria bacterium]
MIRPVEPKDIDDLLTRSRALCGLRLGELARRLNILPPPSTIRGKGWTGQLLERALGAQAGSASQPDFSHLSVELKTLPIAADGLPKESTYVCIAPLLPGPEARFETSCVARKLSRVLWFPVEAGPTVLTDRRLGRAVLWTPSSGQWQRIRTDFDELVELIMTGGVEHITAHIGEVMQIRPKAANAAARAKALGPNGAPILTNPRGFYLRPGFTAEIVGARVR